jgi:hypothetical protein
MTNHKRQGDNTCEELPKPKRLQFSGASLDNGATGITVKEDAEDKPVRRVVDTFVCLFVC